MTQKPITHPLVRDSAQVLLDPPDGMTGCRTAGQSLGPVDICQIQTDRVETGKPSGCTGRIGPALARLTAMAFKSDQVRRQRLSLTMLPAIKAQAQGGQQQVVDLCTVDIGRAQQGPGLLGAKTGAVHQTVVAGQGGITQTCGRRALILPEPQLGLAGWQAGLFA